MIHIIIHKLKKNIREAIKVFNMMRNDTIKVKGGNQVYNLDQRIVAEKIYRSLKVFLIKTFQPNAKLPQIFVKEEVTRPPDDPQEAIKTAMRNLYGGYINNNFKRNNFRFYYNAFLEDMTS